VARRYHVTVRTVERYWKRYRETAQIQPKRQGGYRVSKLAAHDGTLLHWIKQQPDLTLAELQQRCARQLEVSISVHALWYRLERLGLSFKKNHARRRARST
jgi:transposase